MSGAARSVVETFESLPEEEQQEVLAELLRRRLANGYASPDDSDLVLAADQIFRELDRHDAVEQGLRAWLGLA
jgi:hypothetical protein